MALASRPTALHRTADGPTLPHGQGSTRNVVLYCAASRYAAWWRSIPGRRASLRSTRPSRTVEYRLGGVRYAAIAGPGSCSASDPLVLGFARTGDISRRLRTRGGKSGSTVARTGALHLGVLQRHAPHTIPQVLDGIAVR